MPLPPGLEPQVGSLGLRIWDLGFRFQGSGFRCLMGLLPPGPDQVRGLGFRI